MDVAIVCRFRTLDGEGMSGRDDVIRDHRLFSSEVGRLSGQVLSPSTSRPGHVPLMEKETC